MRFPIFEYAKLDFQPVVNCEVSYVSVHVCVNEVYERNGDGGNGDGGNVTMVLLYENSVCIL